jgi:hypothetical protein
VVHGAGSYNDALADAGYNIKVSAIDDFSFTFDSATVKRNNNIIVANKLNDLPLPEDKYPLRRDFEPDINLEDDYQEYTKE